MPPAFARIEPPPARQPRRAAHRPRHARAELKPQALAANQPPRPARATPAAVLLAVLALALGLPAGAAAEEPARPTSGSPAPTAPAGDKSPAAKPNDDEATRLAIKLREQGYWKSWSEAGRRVFVLIGGAELRGGGLVLSADSLVVWIGERELDAARWRKRQPGEARQPPPGDAPRESANAPSPPATPRVKEAAGPGGFGLSAVQVYAEGNVFFQIGGQAMAADLIYFDLSQNRGVISKGVLRGRSQGKRGDLYMRARTIRIHNRLTFEAEDAVLTPCSFAEPHLSLDAESLIYRVTPPGRVVDSSAATFQYEGLPLMMLPAMTNNLDSPLPVRRLTPTSSREWGAGVRSTWDLLAITEPLLPEKQRFDAQGHRLPRPRTTELGPAGEKQTVERHDQEQVDLDLDYLSKRGVGVGPRGVVERSATRFTTFPGGQVAVQEEPEFTTLWRGWYIRDSEWNREDPHLARLYAPTPDPDRGRAMLFHRQHLPGDWEMDVRYSKQTDRDLLREFFEEEEKFDPPQETYVQVRNYHGSGELRLTYQVRTDDFRSVLEKAPAAQYTVDSVPLWEGGALWSSDTSAMNRRVVIDEEALDRPRARAAAALERRRVFRMNTENRLDYPLAFLSPYGLTPHGGGRYTVYDRTAPRENWHGRAQGFAGVRARADAQRVYDVDLPWLDVHGLRHVVTPRLGYDNLFATTDSPGLFIQQDEVDALDRRDEVRLSLQNLLETRRGPVERPKTVSWFDHRLDTIWFPHRGRDNQGRKFGNLEQTIAWQTTDDLRLSSFASYQTTERLVEEANVDAAWKVVPDATVSLGQRVVHRGRARVQTTTASLDAQLTDRWKVLTAAGYDYRARRPREWKVQFTREFHDYRLTLGVDADLEQRDTRFFVTLNPLAFFGGSIGSQTLAP